MQLILASTSPYRRKLLERLGIPFECIPPETQEFRLHREPPEKMAGRLAMEKSRAIAKQYPEALVIGSDQVAARGDTILGKPETHPVATAQLESCSGQEVQFYTGIALTCAETGFEALQVEPYTVKFRQLSAMAIENYLQQEAPYDCAGSFKCEGLGIVLFECLTGNDPTALEGLPLIALTTMLQNAGHYILHK